MADYCSLADLKNALNITDTVDDKRLSAAITAACGWIDSYCGRSFQQAFGTATRDYIPTGRLEVLPIDDATSIVSVAIDDNLDGTFSTVLDEADWQAEPVNDTIGGIYMPFNRLLPIEDGYWPLLRGRATVRVEATFGWPEVPGPVSFASVLQSSRLFARFDSPLGVAGFGEMGVVRVSRFLDSDVQALLEPYRRLGF